MTQAQRYSDLIARTKRDNLDNDFHAAFYLLSSHDKIYQASAKFVDRDGIDFKGIKNATKGFDEQMQFVVDIAHNLFSYDSPCKATPFEISRLGYPFIEQVFNAIYISGDNVKVVVKDNKLAFDTTKYQQKKQSHEFFNSLVNGKQSKSYEPER